MLSPVCTPIGSKFSTVQMITTLSALSLSNSSSYSFQPSTAFSTSTSWIGLAVNAWFSASSNSSFLKTMPPPVPPNVNDGRNTNGKPISCANSFPSKKELAIFAGQTLIPISIIHSRNFSLSSALSMALISTPINCTLYFSHTPNSSASLQRFSAVCPPIVGSTASISFSSKICSILSTVNGKRYTLSAIIGSVIMVAGLLLMRITFTPSSLKLLAACVPE